MCSSSSNIASEIIDGNKLLRRGNEELKLLLRFAKLVKTPPTCTFPIIVAPEYSTNVPQGAKTAIMFIFCVFKIHCESVILAINLNVFHKHNKLTRFLWRMISFLNNMQERIISINYLQQKKLHRVHLSIPPCPPYVLYYHRPSARAEV